jgi:hypothetical protein
LRTAALNERGVCVRECITDLKEMQSRADVEGREEGKFVDQVAGRNAGDSYLKGMQARADVEGKEEGKFVDQVAGRNAGDSYLKEMQARAEVEGKHEGKFVDRNRSEGFNTLLVALDSLSLYRATSHAPIGTSYSRYSLSHRAAQPPATDRVRV